MKQPKTYGCMDYRQEMVLLGLKRKLEQEDLSEPEKQEILRDIRLLESAMDMD